MRNIFQNKKVMIAIIICVVVIVLAIVAFVLLGMSENSAKNKNVSTINLGNSTQTDGDSENEVENETENEVENTVEETEEMIVAEGVDDFYVDVTKQFVAGYMNSDEMQDFIDNYMDPKAFVAYGNVNMDDAAFMDEYMSISDDDESIEELKKTLLQLPEAYQMVVDLAENAQEMVENAENTTGNEIDTENVDFEDTEIKITEIEEPEQSADDDQITSIEATIKLMGQESKIKVVFYGEIVIYVCDENGNSITDDADLGEIQADEETSDTENEV